MACVDDAACRLPAAERINEIATVLVCGLPLPEWGSSLLLGRLVSFKTKKTSFHSSFLIPY
jgi:hypothetical protein